MIQSNLGLIASSWGSSASSFVSRGNAEPEWRREITPEGNRMAQFGEFVIAGVMVC